MNPDPTDQPFGLGNLLFLLSIAAIIPVGYYFVRSWPRWCGVGFCVSGAFVYLGIVNHFIPVRIRGHYWPQSWAIYQIVIGMAVIGICSLGAWKALRDRPAAADNRTETSRSKRSRTRRYRQPR